MSEILPGLYLASYDEADALCAKYGDKSFVVNCTRREQMYAKNGVRIAVDDNGTPQSMNTLYAGIVQHVWTIHEQLSLGNIVVVHCFAGRQRSAAVVCAYLMWLNRTSIEECIAFIKKCRQEAFFPDVNFLASLQLYAEDLNLN